MSRTGKFIEIKSNLVTVSSWEKKWDKTRAHPGQLMACSFFLENMMKIF